MKAIARKLSLRRDRDKDEKKSSDQGATSISAKASSTTPAAASTQQPIPETTATKEDMASGNLPKTYKAAVITGQQKPLEIQDLPMPELKEGELLLKVLACGVCHSDHHVLNGDMGPP
jgi:hypothetical protein